MLRRVLAAFLAGLLAWAPTADAALKAIATPTAVQAGATGAATVLAQSFVPVSAPADTTEDTLATITVPANTLGANGALSITTFWTMTNSANNKTLRLRFSGASGTQYMNAAWGSGTVGVVDRRYIANRNATNSQVGMSAASNPWNGGGSSLVTSSVDTTAATSIVITGQKALGSETLTLEGYIVEIIKP